MAVTIEPLGGLGNQLFIYALGLRLAQDLNTDLKCDTWNFHNYSWHIYELESFRNSISYTYSSRWRERFGHKTRGFSRRLRNLPFIPTSYGSLVLESGSTFDESILRSPNGTRLNGYFQSWRYFEPVAEELRHQVANVTAPSAWLSKTRTRLAALGDWIAVHVRRGTYLQVPIMGLVGVDYYQKAIDLVSNLVGDLPLVVFSDSPEYIPNLLAGYETRIVRVETPPEVRAIDVLQVMSSASHLIMANSTFSWWASYLENRPNRRIVAPRPWLDDKSFNERDLLLPEWITVGRYSP